MFSSCLEYKIHRLILSATSTLWNGNLLGHVNQSSRHYLPFLRVSSSICTSIWLPIQVDEFVALDIGIQQDFGTVLLVFCYQELLKERGLPCKWLQVKQINGCWISWIKCLGKISDFILILKLKASRPARIPDKRSPKCFWPRWCVVFSGLIKVLSTPFSLAFRELVPLLPRPGKPGAQSSYTWGKRWFRGQGASWLEAFFAFHFFCLKLDLKPWAGSKTIRWKSSIFQKELHVWKRSHILKIQIHQRICRWFLCVWKLRVLVWPEYLWASRDVRKRVLSRVSCKGKWVAYPNAYSAFQTFFRLVCYCLTRQSLCNRCSEDLVEELSMFSIASRHFAYCRSWPRAKCQPHRGTFKEVNVESHIQFIYI